MYTKKSAKPTVITITVLVISVLCGGFFAYSHYDGEIMLYETSKAHSAVFFEQNASNPFINSMAGAEPVVPPSLRDGALFCYETPEGFPIVSRSRHWNPEMLELLYQELMLNAHGDEMTMLSGIVIYPDGSLDANAAAVYAPGIYSAGFFLRYGAFPDGFSIDFPAFSGTISLFNGDTKTTVESIASDLSHEYGHHFTHYHMFDTDMLARGLLGESEYGKLREAQKYNLISDTDSSTETYRELRHMYLVETAAEDYVTLMGSPATRQVEEYFDVKQITDDSELAGERRSERNAFPQENMMLPLAIDVPELEEYFYSFIPASPRLPAHEKQEITLGISRESKRFRLEDGYRDFVYYEVTWNVPYSDAVYTLACFDPSDYTGYGYPVKTYRPANSRVRSASATVGNYAVQKRRVVYSSDDGLAEGVKMFYVVAQIPDGTYYASELYEVNFG